MKLHPIIIGLALAFFLVPVAVFLAILISTVSPPQVRRAVLVERPDPAAEGCAADCGALDPLLVHYDDGQTECLCRPWGC